MTALAALYCVSASPPDGLYGHYVIRAHGVPAAAVTAGLSQYDFMGRMCGSLDAADVFLCHYWWRDGMAGKLHSAVLESDAVEKAQSVLDAAGTRLELSKDMYMTESEGMFDWDAYSAGPARRLTQAGSTGPASVTVYLVDGPVAVTTEVLVRDAFESFSINGTKGSPCALAHGTHVASLIAGVTFGDAATDLVSVAVMPGCGRPSRTSELVAGLDWILDRAISKGTVVAISVLTPDSSIGDIVAEKVSSLVSAGAFVMTAAGDNADDACLYVPPKLPGVLTVASAAWALTGGTGKAEPAETTNYGPCIDVWAIGEVVEGAGASNGSRATYSGTAQAMAQVAKAVVGSWNLTAAETQRRIVRESEDDVMQALTPLTTPLFLRHRGGGGPRPPVYCACP